MSSSENISYWYFDVISPFAYLQWVALQRVNQPLNLQPVPVLFAGLLKHHGQLGPAEIPSKRTYTYRYVTWLARQQNVPLQLPSGHPFNPLPILRLVIAAGATSQHVLPALESVWRHGHLPDDPDAMASLARQLGISDWRAAIADDEVKNQLKTNTTIAIERGVFGVPTLWVNGEIFWGQDSTGMYLDYLNHPERFNDAAMQRASTLPSVTHRQRP